MGTKIIAYFLLILALLSFDKPKITIVLPNNACMNDTLHFQSIVTGGVPPYTYKWVGGMTDSLHMEDTDANPIKVIPIAHTFTITALVIDSIGVGTWSVPNIFIVKDCSK